MCISTFIMSNIKEQPKNCNVTYLHLKMTDDLGMKDPVSYSRYNKLQHRDNMRCLEENIKRMRWRGNDRVLDIGSGDGSFTAERLRRFLPADLQLLLGADKSEEMVRYASERYQGGELKFELLEIGKILPKRFIGSFDHIFSFFSLHWIKDQRLVISQLYDILCDGGDCLVLIVANFPIVFDVYKWFSRSARWSHWVKQLDELVSPYHDMVDPEAELTRIAKEVGFQNVYVKCKRSTYTYATVEDIKSMMSSINPFEIPKELMGEYLEEFVQVARDQGYLSEDLTISYTTNTFYGRK